VVFLADYLAILALALVMVSPLYFMGVEAWRDFLFPAQLVCFVVSQLILPFFNQGKTIFGALTGLTLDDHKRSQMNRVLLYGLRALWIGIILFGDRFMAGGFAIGVLISWVLLRKMPYRIVDIFFHKK
jgi:hypothetical protein